MWVQDTVRSNQLPSLAPLYNSGRAAYLGREGRPEGVVPASDHTFDIRLETEARQVGKQVGRMVAAYLAEMRAPPCSPYRDPADRSATGMLTASCFLTYCPFTSCPLLLDSAGSPLGAKIR